MNTKEQANQNKEEAKNNGKKQYDGVECTKCKTSIRFSSNGGCVGCGTSRSQLYAQKRAKQATDSEASNNRARRNAVIEELNKAQDERFPNSVQFKHKKFN